MKELRVPDLRSGFHRADHSQAAVDYRNFFRPGLQLLPHREKGDASGTLQVLLPWPSLIFSFSLPGANQARKWIKWIFFAFWNPVIPSRSSSNAYPPRRFSELGLFLYARLEPQAEWIPSSERGARIGFLELAHLMANYRCTVMFYEGWKLPLASFLLSVDRNPLWWWVS